MEKQAKYTPCKSTFSADEAHALRLIHDISRLTHARIRQDCPEIQRSCRLIMRELAREENVTQLHIVRATNLKAPTVSVCLQKMELDGLVTRRPDEDDLRAMRVSLTEKGYNMHREILGKVKEQEMKIESCLTKEELATLQPLLAKIMNNLRGGCSETD